MINQTSILMSNLYITAPHTRAVQWNKAKRTINQVINIMLIYHARQLDLLLLISNSKLTLLQHVTQFHMRLSKNISQTPNFKTRVICYTFTGLQIIFQKLSDMMSGKNKIPLDIYENLLKINFCVFKNSNKIQLLLGNISPLVHKSRIYTVRC